MLVKERRYSRLRASARAFLPATKAQPKEMLPVVDKPLIQYAVEEAYAAGVREMIFVTGRHKRPIEDHFDMTFELEVALEQSRQAGTARRGAQRQAPTTWSASTCARRRRWASGHAVLCGQRLIGQRALRRAAGRRPDGRHAAGAACADGRAVYAELGARRSWRRAGSAGANTRGATASLPARR